MKQFFSFLCAVLLSTGLYAQQLNEGFEGESFPPEGWTTIDGYAGYGWKKAAKSGHNCAMISEVYGTESWLITPQLKPADGENLQFSAIIGDYASTGELRIEVSLSGTDAGSFEPIDTYYTSTKKGDAAHQLWKSEWKEYTIDLSAYKGSAIYIGFHQVGSTEKIYIDDVQGVSLKGDGECENPSNIVLSNLDAHSATFTWQGDATEYQYVLVEDGEEADWTAATLVAAKTVTLSGLYEETNYTFYVRSYCSDDAQSLAPKMAFKTPCEAFNIPWLETFTRDETGSGFDVAEPDCWTVATQGQISVVKDKTYDDEGNASTVNGQAHLQAMGGGPNSEQVFAMPTFTEALNTLEVAFDYKTSLTDATCGSPEIGYMTNPNKASTFVSLQTLAKSLTYQHVTISLEDLPANAKFIAFRFAGGTSDYCTLAMDNFVVAEIGKSGEVDPSQEDIPDAGIWSISYCEASFVWFSYNAEAFAIGLFDAATQELIAGTAVTTGECDRFAQADGVGFSEDEDYENKYYCSTKWILNVDESGLSKGNAWTNDVINIGTATAPVLGLKPGTYQVQVYALKQTDTGYERGETLATIPFTLVEKKVTDLAVSVADDKTTATLSWTAPEFGQGERVYVRVWAGETVAYDNLDTKTRPESPLTVNVEEGLSYTAIVQVIDKNNNPLGSEQQVLFTVGVNNFEPTNLHAEVFGGDNVTFTWDATSTADRYVITLFCDGEFYATLTVNGKSKTTTMPKDGTWSWTVQAFNEGENGNYFEASNAIAGADFVSKAADIPEDAIVMDVWGMEAAYLDEYVAQFPAGKYGWYITFATNEAGGTGYPMPTFLIYTDKERAISGVYNVARGGIDAESCYINVNGKQEDAITATDAELRLQFDGYDEEKAESGYAYGYYTGSFRLVGSDGKTYVGKFMEMFCNSFNFSTYGTIRDHVGMYDEDPNALWGIESIQPSEVSTQKILHDGQLYIVRPNGTIYNATGVRVK